MKYVFLIIVYMTISLTAHPQTDIVGEGFKTAPDNVYGVLVGVLIAFGVGVSGLCFWIVRKIFGWLESYRSEKAESETAKSETFGAMLHELQEMRVGQTKMLEGQIKQGEDITEIKGDLHGLRGKVDDIEKDVDILKSRFKQGE